MTGSGSQHSNTGQQFRIDTDHQLHAMMKQEIQRLHGRSIDIRLDKDCVLLSGTVNSWSDKQQAQESIRGLSGSHQIRNDVKVVKR